MGAKTVEAVQDVDDASDKSFSTYDYIVLINCDYRANDGNLGSSSDNEGDSAHKSRDMQIKAPYVPWAWLKDCLIANQLLPKPKDVTPKRIPTKQRTRAEPDRTEASGSPETEKDEDAVSDDG
jgi:hypothetical protein